MLYALALAIWVFKFYYIHIGKINDPLGGANFDPLGEQILTPGLLVETQGF
jgi:hypothetical protein